MRQREPHGDFARNLRLLCSFYPSITHVCRRMGISRAQFNRYLSGASTPSSYNRRRLATFFEVDPDTLAMDHDTFRERISRKSVDSTIADPLTAFVDQLPQRFPESQIELQKYLGYYNSYYVLPYDRRVIHKSLQLVYQAGARTYARAILADHHRHDEDRGYTGRFDGVVLIVEDRLYLVEYEARAPARFGMTILYPSHKASVAGLTGLYLGVSSSDLREPISIAIHYRYLGQDINLRAELEKCGNFESGHPAIPTGVEQRLRIEESRSHRTRESLIHSDAFEP